MALRITGARDERGAARDNAVPAERLRVHGYRDHNGRPKAYTRPWGTSVEVSLLPNTQLMEFIYLENEKDTRGK